MLSKSKTLFTLVFSLFFLFQAHAQIYASPKALDQIKDGNTYVVVNNLNFPGSDEYYRVLKKYWTVTKGVEFLKASELAAKLKAGDSYFTMVTDYENYGSGGSATYTNYGSGGIAPSTNYGSGGSAAFYYLSLWVPTEKALEEGRKLDIKNTNAIAGIYVAVHADIGKRIGIPVLDFDGGGHIANWNPGTFKNYIQRLNDAIQSGKRLSSDDKANKEQLKLLKNQTLYVPDENFYTTSFSHKTEKYEDAEIAGLFKGYKSDYKVITSGELKDKILTDTEPFFYLIHVTQTNRGTITAVVNSRTGDIIYLSHHLTFSHNLSSSDLKDIYKFVDKD
ncbi:MAG: hypothetical protein ABI203_00105 [Mucilaginibacter sp.]